MSSWLRVINYTDCYTLDNFARLRSLIDEKRAECKGSTVVLCSGDFLAPYLLSSLDRGRSMVALMNALPVDVATLGNHEDDLPFDEFCKRVGEFKGAWVSSNMQIPECRGALKDTLVLDVGENRRVGIVGVLSNEPALYRKNAFGGATIQDPYDALERCSKELRAQGVDFILPVEHLYVPQDYVTCERFDFPVVISGSNVRCLGLFVFSQLSFPPAPPLPRTRPSPCGPGGAWDATSQGGRRRKTCYCA